MDYLPYDIIYILYNNTFMLSTQSAKPDKLKKNEK